MNRNVLYKSLRDSKLHYKEKLEFFVDNCNKALDYLHNKIESKNCTEEQAFIINKLESWMSLKGYKMLADTVSLLELSDEKNVDEFIEFYEFMLQCSAGNIEKLIDQLFYIPEQFMKQFTKASWSLQIKVEREKDTEKYWSYVVMRKGIFDEIPFFNKRREYNEY